MLWKDFQKGMLVEVHADDYFDTLGDQKKLTRHEYPFTVMGEIVEVTQRTMWVMGVWTWHCPDEWCNEDDPQRTAGLFGVPRRGPERIYVLGRLHTPNGYNLVWISPMPD